MAGPGGYKKLRIYALAHELGLKVHSVSLNLPSFERYEQGSQIRRSSKSVSSNIVEGYSLRKYKNLYLSHLYYAFGSSEETVEHLEYLFQTGSLKDETLFKELLASYRQLSSMIFAFIERIERGYRTPSYLSEEISENPVSPSHRPHTPRKNSSKAPGPQPPTPNPQPQTPNPIQERLPDDHP